jgi:integrase
MAGARRNPQPGGKFQGYYKDQHDRRQFFTGTRSRSETVRIARSLEDEHRQVKLGYRPARTTAARYASRLFQEICDEHIAWGASQGGLGGRAWSDWHRKKRTTHLRWWHDRLGLRALGDLNGVLPRVEEELRDLQKTKSGKTVANYAESLKALGHWAVQRGYLDTDPLKALAPFDTTPQTLRRTLTVDEIQSLLRVADPARRLLYEVALLSGLRAGELRQLSTDHLDRTNNGLTLDASWTKNRKAEFQPLPAGLIERMSASAENGEARGLYDRHYRRSDAQRGGPSNPILFVPSSLSRCLDQDLKRAGISKVTVLGKLDFHALRTTYVNLVLESGVSPKEAQALARHSSPNLTFNVYGRTSASRLSEAVEGIAERVLQKRECATSVQQLAVGAERENATAESTGSCVSQGMVEPRGIEPLTS